MSRVNLEDSIMERPLIKNGFRLGITQLPNSNSTLDADMGPALFITGTASRTLTLPAVPANDLGRNMRGLTFFIVNNAAFTVVVNNSAAAAVATVPATVGATGMIVCLGDPTLGIGGWSGGL